ncbi:unnamed protein product [Polarella glacialis]|uniref:Cellulase n=1 Tax=Polarella glacialis TaxID=89957 RepID=A0A813E172_POLGL|nr:unnamed protein product [Polarella glacialis]
MARCRGMCAVVLLLVLVGAKENEEDCSLIQHSRKSSFEHEEKLKQEDRPASVPLLETAEKRTDKMHFDLFIQAAGSRRRWGPGVKAGPGVRITGPPFDGGNKGSGATWGCGKYNQKCSCVYDYDGFRMKGTGSSGTWTGLDFTCSDVKYEIPGGDTCTCTYRVAITYWGGTKHRFSQECSPKQCYKFVDYPGAPGGHVQDLEAFTNPPSIIACSGGKKGLGCPPYKYSVQAEALGSVEPMVDPSFDPMNSAGVVETRDVVSLPANPFSAIRAVHSN